MTSAASRSRAAARHRPWIWRSTLRHGGGRTSLLVTGSALTTATMKSAWRWVLDVAPPRADNWGRCALAGARPRCGAQRHVGRPGP